MAISIRWYHVSDDNQDRPIADSQQEDVKREDEQIIGSYLNISKVSANHYGRYLCRVEMGNSQTHRLEMSAELINALPIEADNDSILLNPYFLAACAALITIFLFFLVLRSQQCCTNYLVKLNSNELEILNMKAKNLESPSAMPKLKKSTAHRHKQRDDTKIMIDAI